MGKILSDKPFSLDKWKKCLLVASLTLVVSIFMYQGWLKPLIIDSATNTYYFKLDGTAQNVGTDGNTSTFATLGGKISMYLGTTYNTIQSVTAASNTNWQTLTTVYGPAYGSDQTLSSPAVTIGTRDRNGTANLIYWKADIYDYNPAGSAGNGVLLWSTTGTDESHPSTTTAKALTFSSPAAKLIPTGHRLKVIISCRMTSTNSLARFYWGGGATYSFMTVTETAVPANTVAVTNLADYSGGLTSVLQGEQNVCVLKLDLYANATTSWTGGKLDKIGTNANLADATFSIYKDANGNGIFEPTSDTMIGGPYSFTQATGASYALASQQALTTSPQKYFITFNIAETATANTTIGARIANNSYFTVTNGLTVGAVSSASSSTPTINATGTPITKTYMADWNSGTTLYRPETAGQTVTNSGCITTTTTVATGTSLVGLLNYPSHSCASSATAYFQSSAANSKFVTLYYNPPSGYPSIMTQIKGVSLKLRVAANSYASPAPVFTATMFYVKPDGTRVNSSVAKTYTPSVATTATLSLAGQTLTNVPAGSRIGVQIGVNKSGCRVALGSAVGAQMVVEETAAVNTGVDIGDGSAIAGRNVLASSTNNIVDSFTLVRPAGNQTITAVTISGNSTTDSTNVSLVKLYADNGTIGALDGADSLLGTGTFSGNSVTITGLTEVVGTTAKKYLIAYDVSATPVTGSTLTGQVTSLTGEAIDVNQDTGYATLTILPTTTIGNGTSEPANTIIPSGGSATNIDAFSLGINGGVNDQVTSVTVSLASPDITLPAKISDYIAKVEIVDRNTATVYGELTAPSSGDDWRVNTTNLFATPANTQCYLRMTPKSTIVSTYRVTGLVTAITHLKTANGMINNDTSGATVTLDGQAPTNPVLSASSGTNGGEINLSWTAATDSGGLHATTPYILVRGAKDAPAPSNCSTGTQVYQGTLLSKTDTGLDPGHTYAYRVCAKDSVGNTSSGTTKSAKAQLPTVCTNAPSVSVNPTSHFIKAGQQAQFTVSISNNDTGTCSNTPFIISLVGTENSTDFTTPSTISQASLSLAPNGGGGSSTITVTAKPMAEENAVDTFTVRVTATGHPTVNFATPLVVTVNDFGSMIHSSNALGTKKYGAWGLKYTCATCHSYEGGNIKLVYGNVSSPTGRRTVVFSRTTGSAGVTSKVFGNDLRSGTTTTNICEVCHHQTRFHQYSAEKIAIKTHNNVSNCMVCHPHRAGFNYVGGGSCTDCHGNPPTSFAEMVFPPSNALGQFAANAGAHAKHNDHMRCTTCHSNGNHALSATPNNDNLLQLGFSINSSNFPGFRSSITTGTYTGTDNLTNGYSWATAVGTTLLQGTNSASCLIYCHGWDGAGGANSEPNWDGIGQKSCGTCHAATGDNPPPSGSHAKHVGTGPTGNGIACTKCHGTYSNYSTSAAHINGIVQWNLSQVSGSATYKGSNSGTTGAVAPTSAASYGSCGTLYCHSNVQSANGTAGPSSYAAPVWGGTVSCGNCHVDMGTNPSATGGHLQHAQDPNTQFECRICHSTGGDTNPQNHANGQINFAFSGLAANTVYSKGSFKVPGSGGYGICSSSDCHGRRTISWGPSTGTPLCDKCHGSATSGGFYDTNGPGSSTANTGSYVGAHDQHIMSAPYNFSAPSDCGECHQKPAGPYSPGHMDNQLPAEVNLGDLANRGTFFGFTSLPTYDPVNRTCSNTWCHGAGMDSNTGNGPYATLLEDGEPSLFTPTTPTWNSPFLNGTGSNDCTKCHGYPPAAPTSNYSHWEVTTAAGQCHKCHRSVNSDNRTFSNSSTHVNGIVNGCNDCHGRPPIDLAGLVVPSLNAMNPGKEGAHNGHILNPNIGKECNVCHNNYTIDMPADNLQIGFNAFNGRVTTGTFWGYSTLANNKYVSSSAGTIVRRTNVTALQNHCTNLYCHGSTLSGGTITDPEWELGYTQSECGACHGATASTYKTTGSHGRHAGDGTGNLQLTCSLCHGQVDNNYHVDGSVKWYLNTSDGRIGNFGTYSGTASGVTNRLAPSPSFGRCNMVYCHSNVQGNAGSGNPSSYNVPRWGGANPSGCNWCHADMSTTFTGSHQIHTQYYACNICHATAGSGTTKHGNFSIDIVFDSSVAGTVYSKGTAKVPGDGYGSCSSIPCHDGNSATWGQAPGTLGYTISCLGCHRASLRSRVAVLNDFNGQSHHIQGTVVAVTHCYQCHGEANNDGSINATYHDKTKVGAAISLTNYSSGSRSATYINYTANGAAARKRTEYAKINRHCLGCHNNNSGAAAKFTGDSYTPNKYAWDSQSINKRYNQTGTTAWGKVSGNQSNAKSGVTKALSAHGRADLNNRGWSTTTGTDTAITNTSGNAVTSRVLCFDCHNSHGSTASGITSNYSSATGRNKGGLLKTTTSGKGGYSVTYIPTAGGSASAPDKNVYNPGAGICFDCHFTQNATSSIPWGYQGTFNSTQPIMGYFDTIRFGNSTSGFVKRNVYRQGYNNNKGGHFGASNTLFRPASKQINGICTPCHDPHGVSQSLTTNQQYAVPLLKGTWMTSPYQEDVPPQRMDETRGGTNESSNNGVTGGSTTRPIRQNVGSTPGYQIDQNAFSALPATTTQNNYGTPQDAQSYLTTNPNAFGALTDTQFAGLCTGCHSKTNLVYPNTTTAKTGNWKKMRRIHMSVDGWAATAGGGNAGNAVHTYTCSKCHTPHNSGLPRLMVTNCLDYKHRGRVSSGGSVSATAGNSSGTGGSSSIPNSGHQSVTGQKGSGQGRFPSGGNWKTRNSSTKSQNPGTWFFGLGPTANTYAGAVTNASGQFRACHDSATAGGTSSYPSNQLWNTVTPW